MNIATHVASICKYTLTTCKMLNIFLLTRVWNCQVPQSLVPLNLQGFEQNMIILQIAYSLEITLPYQKHTIILATYKEKVK